MCALGYKTGRVQRAGYTIPPGAIVLLGRWALEKETREQENRTGWWESALGSDGEVDNEIMGRSLPGEAQREQRSRQREPLRQKGGWQLWDQCGCPLAEGRE